MQWVEGGTGLKFNQYPPFDNQVSDVITDGHSAIVDFQWDLLLALDICRLQFDRECIGIDFSRKPTPSVLCTLKAALRMAPVSSCSG